MGSAEAFVEVGLGEGVGGGCAGVFESAQWAVRVLL